jgi:hypothetical protein
MYLRARRLPYFFWYRIVRRALVSERMPVRRRPRLRRTLRCEVFFACARRRRAQPLRAAFAWRRGAPFHGFARRRRRALLRGFATAALCRFARRRLRRGFATIPGLCRRARRFLRFAISILLGLVRRRAGAFLRATFLVVRVLIPALRRPFAIRRRKAAFALP